MRISGVVKVIQISELILIPTVNTGQEPMEMFEQEIHSCLTGRNSYEKADDTEQIIYTDIDIRESRRIRNKKPYTSLRRKEFYLQLIFELVCKVVKEKYRTVQEWR